VGTACRNFPADFNPDEENTYDGWTLAMSRNDDGSSGAYTIPFEFSFYGEQYEAGTKTLYINNNGNLSFDRSLSSFSSTGFPVRGTPIIAPFWTDVDTRDTHDGHVWMKQFGNTLAVTWDKVGYFGQAQDDDKRNTFQVLISDGLDSSMGLGNNMCFCYENMDWTTGTASGGSNGYGGIPATVGANSGDGTTFFQTGRFGIAGGDYDGSGGTADGVDYLDNASICADIRGVNIPPIPANFPAGNAITLDTCEPFDLIVDFLSPELSQTTSVVVTGNPIGMSIVSTSGTSATSHIKWTPDHDEVVTLTFVATDNGNVAGVTTVSLEITANNCPIPTAAPSASPTFESVSHDVCENYAVHAGTTVTFGGVMSTVHNGDMGVHPGTDITGSYTLDNGQVVLDSTDFSASFLEAYDTAMDAEGTEFMPIEIGGLTFEPGSYRSGSAINIASGTVVTLDGLHQPNPVFLFQAVASTLITAADTYFILKNGAKAENVHWALGTAATLGANSILEGSILAGTSITFGTGSELRGCALAKAAVTFESNGSVQRSHYIGDDIIDGFADLN
jgi:hypothetical protein